MLISDSWCLYVNVWQLVCVLRDVKYLRIGSFEDIPESASTIYNEGDNLWKYITNLDLTVQSYNRVRQTVLEVEYSLIESQLMDIDQHMKLAETTLMWTSDGTV